MEDENKIKTKKFSFTKRHLIFFLILLALLGGAILLSSVATRLESFTFDEAYHIGAGAAYVKTGDFRLNPEHPPLVKLWTGAFVADVYQISPYRKLQDKSDEPNHQNHILGYDFIRPILQLGFQPFPEFLLNQIRNRLQILKLKLPVYLKDALNPNRF